MSAPRVLHGDCLLVMPTLEPASVDAIVCDPPYGLGFMGKAWDHGVPGVLFWEAALRVAKPGAHLVAFGGTRTYHRLTVAIEDAGWEIRDCLSWLYGSGFPKSLDVSKAMDKSAGHWRVRASAVESGNGAMAGPNYGRTDKGEPITQDASTWKGWGTALKPAWEPIILARKPLVGTVAANVLLHSTGALNIDGCRIEGAGNKTFARDAGERSRDQYRTGTTIGAAVPSDTGRWPANVCLDEDAAAVLDSQSGTLTSNSGEAFNRNSDKHRTAYSAFAGRREEAGYYGDTGGASRFFYTAKASRSERNAGLDALPVKQSGMVSNTSGQHMTRRDGGAPKPAANHHPTVKPLDLMQWLCRLVTPKGGLILDPFTGSGSTGRAAVAEGFRFLGIELSEEYAEIARARIHEYAPLFGGAA